MDYQVRDALQRIAFALEYAHRIEGTPGGARSREPQPRPPPTSAPGPYRQPAVVVRHYDEEFYAAVRAFWAHLGIHQPDNDALQKVLDAHARVCT
jgi:hypothetical protein